jgi:hypothetical protein
MLREQTRDFILRMSDADLLACIRTGVAEYETEAVTFAQEEFRRRDLNAARVAELATIVADQQREEGVAAAELATMPLSRKGRIFAYIAGFFLFGLPFLFVFASAAQFKNRGEMKKAADVWSSFGLGILSLAALWALIGLTIFVLSHVLG